MYRMMRLVAVCLLILCCLISVACKTRSSDNTGSYKQTTATTEAPAATSPKPVAEPAKEPVAPVSAKTEPAVSPPKSATVTANDIQTAADNMVAAVLAVCQGDAAAARPYLVQGTYNAADIPKFSYGFNTALSVITGKAYVPFYVVTDNPVIVDVDTITFDLYLEYEGLVEGYPGVVMKRKGGTWKMTFDSFLRALSNGGLL